MDKSTPNPTALPIAAVNSKTGYTFSTRHQGICYEWYYVELFEEKSHLVLILSLKDPFLAGNPPSLYCTWFDGEICESYSYIQLMEAEYVEFKSKITDFFEFKSNQLALNFGCHSGDFGLNLALHWQSPEQPDPDTGGLGGLTSPDFLSCFKDAKHFWQPLRHGKHLLAQIRKTDITKETSRAAIFFDVPLAKKLSRQQKTSTSKLSQNFGDQSVCYVDHNAGKEPLQELDHPWFWWHWHNGAEGEIGYFFPHLNAGYRLNSNKKTTAIHKADLWDLKYSQKHTGFGVPYPSTIENFKMAHTIEAAPFYMRGKLEVKKVSTHLITSHHALPFFGTVESLSPAIVGTRLNQRLMRSRLMFGSVLGSYIGLDFFEFCKQVTKQNGKSFYFSSLVLPVQTKRRSYVTYMLCRMIDDATDDESVRSKFGGSKVIEELLDLVFSDSLPLNLSKDLGGFLDWFILKNGQLSAHDLVCNLQQFVKLENWECTPFEGLLQGQKADESFAQPKNQNEFMHYCYLVAGVVGILMARAFGAPLDSTPQAISLGNAMQITNILRDVREDCLELQRVYLPVSLFNYDQKNVKLNLLLPSKQTDFINSWNVAYSTLGTQACELYAQALVASQSIPLWPARLCVRLMIGIYGAILGDLLQNPSLAMDRRIVISFKRKVWIFVCIVLGRSPLKCAGICLIKANQNLQPQP